MKSFSSISMLLLLVLMSACTRPKKTETIPTKTSGNVSIKFNNKISGQPILQGGLNYTNDAGNLFSVDLLKYYISNVVLVNKDGNEVKLNNYDLINAFDSDFSSVEAINVPNGEYTSMKFLMGIDAVRNHSGAQEGDLDPIHVMIWTWSTGYIFFKHEGNFKNSAGATQALTFHLGTDNGLSTLQIPINLTVNGANKIMNIAFDLNKMYNAPLLDFNVENNRMSTKAADSTWIQGMVSNTNDAFSFEGTN